MIFEIPTHTGASQYTRRVTLDGVSFTLDFNWNGREAAWYLSLYDATGAALLLSRKLSTNSPILSRFRFVPGLPAGELVAVDTSNSIPYAGYTELGPGRGVSLIYYDRAELAGL